MTELLTSAQMRAIEAAAIASGAVTGLDLMERAGAGVVAAVLEEWPELALSAQRAVVLCGPGGNGGDGFVVARLLKARGWGVRVLALCPPEKMPPDAAAMARLWLELGTISELTEDNFRWPDGSPFDFRKWPRDDLVVDAIFGSGLSRSPEGEINELLRHIGGEGGDGPYYQARTVSIDMPSGLCADSGRILMPYYDEVPLRARLTVTFERPKVGHFLAEGPGCCGKIVVKDLGLALWRRTSPSDRRSLRVPRILLVRQHDETKSNDIEKWMSEVQPDRLAKQPDWPTNGKYGHGHALILSGPPGHGGAARLAARGALRIGAGVVTVGAAPEAIPEHAARLDAIMLRAVGDGAALAAVLEDWRINALCLGPGLGVDARAAGLVAVALGIPIVPGSTRDLDSPGATERAERTSPSDRGPGSSPGRLRREGPSVVIDADALTHLSRDPALFAALHDRCILTPHAGEFARLFPDIAAKLTEPATKGPAYSKVDATREAAARAGCVVLLKGPDTVIADPTGRCRINSAHYDRAAPWLATAGSGDVLAGFITGLLARGFAPMQAAETAAWLHVECALKFGPGLIAEDLPEMLPQVFRDLGL